MAPLVAGDNDNRQLPPSVRSGRTRHEATGCWGTSGAIRKRLGGFEGVKCFSTRWGARFARRARGTVTGPGI